MTHVVKYTMRTNPIHRTGVSDTYIIVFLKQIDIFVSLLDINFVGLSPSSFITSGTFYSHLNVNDLSWDDSRVKRFKMGSMLGKQRKNVVLSKIEKKMVDAMKERRAAGKSSLKSFNSIIMKFSTIDQTFEDVRETFKKFDANGNGTLEVDEVKDCFKELQISFSDEEVEDLYRESDMDASKGIDFKEFIVLLALVYLLEPFPNESRKSRLGLPQLEISFDRIADAFIFFDKDGDGFVSKSEIVEAIGQASPGSRNANRIGIRRFEEMDWDKSGLITFKEFLFAFTNWVDIKDEDDQRD